MDTSTAEPLVSLDLANSVFTDCIRGVRLAPVEHEINIFREVLNEGQHIDPCHLLVAHLARFFITFQLDDFQAAFKLRLEISKTHVGSGVSNSKMGNAHDSIECEPVDARPCSHTFEELSQALPLEFRQSVDTFNIDRCIQLYRDVICLQDHPGPLRFASLNSLASALVTRFLCSTNISDLDESVVLCRQLLGILSPSLRLYPLLSLVAVLLMRSINSSGDQDLKDAGSLIPEVSKASEDRRALLGRARACLLKCDEPGQLDEAISHYQEAAMFLPIRCPDRPSLLNDLANALSLRFSDNHQLSDLEDAVKHYQEAQKYYLISHPSYSNISRNLGKTLMRMYSSSHNQVHLESAMVAFREAMNCELSPISVRFNTAREWAQYAHTHRHSSSLEAYRSAIDLLPRFSLLGAGNFRSRRSFMTSVTAGGLVCSAAACAIREDKLEEAVEMLEGRAVFWTQALQLRTPLDELLSDPKAQALGEQLKNISKKLEQSSIYEPSALNQGMSVEKERSYFQSLHDDYFNIIEEIRRLDNFYDFLLPKSIASLRLAAANGPVVILTAAIEAGCDALIVTLDGVHHVPLPSIAVIEVDSLRSLLQVALAPNGTRSAFIEHINETLKDVIPPHRDQRLGKRVSAIGQGSEDMFRAILSTLWNHIVRPVLRSLNLKKSTTPPRLWWCATGPFAFLPIHAAGIYDLRDGELDCVSDYVISSYTPTLSTLLLPLPVSAGPFKVVVAIQPEIPNEPRLRLPSTREELVKIQEYIPSKCLVVLGTPETSTSIDAVLHHLLDASIVHFACHGRQFPSDPLKSSLLLTDGDLEVSHIINQPTPNAQLAFLSACETAMGDEELPDEVIHIAAAVLFAGFRGVVATMWTIHDKDGPKIADSFYHHIFRGHTNCTNTTPDTREAAQALYLAVKKLRSEKDCTFQRWVPFIHLGL